jgi:hypothetical protein
VNTGVFAAELNVGVAVSILKKSWICLLKWKYAKEHIIEEKNTITVSRKIILKGFTSLSKYFISTIFAIKNKNVIAMDNNKTCSIIH